jgi:NADP-dependent aldehyde dehydrogenase
LPGDFHEADATEIDEAVKLASSAFLEYRKKSGVEKADFLEAIAKEIEGLDSSLIERCGQETALPEGRLTGEKGRTMGQLRLFAGLLREGSWVNATIELSDPDRQPLPKPDIRSMEIAIGPVAVFGASNFPLAFSVCGGDTVSALAAGCPVVVKAHQAHAGTSEIIGKAIMRAIEKTNMPQGVFSMVHGGVDTGVALVQHPGIKAVGFTGSFKGGKAIFDLAAARPEPIPVYAEMGSVNPVFILPEILKEKGDTIAQGFISSVNMGVGQFCTNPGLLITDSATFPNQLVETLQATKGGAALTEGIQKAYKSGVEKALNESGVSVLAKGQPIEAHTAVEPHLLQVSANDFLKSHQLKEEIFGPVSIIVNAKDKSEMMSICENLEGHLTATVFGTDNDLKSNADLLNALELKVGRLIINTFPTGVEVCHAMIHGGPFPSTTSPASTSVGSQAIYRFTRPVCYQGFPQDLLPEELRSDNPTKIWRKVNGAISNQSV